MRLSTIVACIAAFLSASLAPTASALVLGLPLGLASWVFLIALAHALVFGLPVGLPLLFTVDRRFLNAGSFIAVGALVGALPFGLWTWSVGSVVSSSFNNVVLVENGVRTIAGWLSWAKIALFFAGYGAVGGFAFWAVLKASGFFGNILFPDSECR